jgi:ABC-2 type transport system ATP-binding protein
MSIENDIKILNDSILHQDYNLFSRKVLDAIADTNEMQLYQKGIDYIDKITQNENDLETKERVSIALWEEVKPQIKVLYNQPKTIITAKDICKSYGYSRFALGPVSLTIQQGEVYGLVGENGNGKTTLLRILAHDLSYDSGEISYHLDYKDSYDLRTKLVYIPQRTEKWYGSLLDNLKFVLANYNVPAEEINLRVLLMVARLGLWKYKDLNWNELSSGYKMRFELARTLLRKPQILLLDEPLANLDILSQQIILEDLKNICASSANPIALILSSQQLYEVEKVADKIIFLKNGKYQETHSVEKDKEVTTQLIVEIDTICNRDEILNTFSNLALENIKYNGGIYMISFREDTSFYDVMNAIVTHKLDIQYIRNISNSTRRFFIS